MGIVERLTNMMMIGGHCVNGKKQNAVRTVRETMELIHLLTGKNPIAILMEAIMHCGAREDSTRIGSGGVVRREDAFRTIKSLSECLCDEIINASKGPGSNSKAVRKKDEIERVAKGNR